MSSSKKISLATMVFVLAVAACNGRGLGDDGVPRWAIGEFHSIAGPMGEPSGNINNVIVHEDGTLDYQFFSCGDPIYTQGRWERLDADTLELLPPTDDAPLHIFGAEIPPMDYVSGVIRRGEACGQIIIEAQKPPPNDDPDRPRRFLMNAGLACYQTNGVSGCAGEPTRWCQAPPERCEN